MNRPDPLAAPLGEIVLHEGAICLQTRSNVWFPLWGNSGIAEDFRACFGEPLPSDVGRLMYRRKGVIQIENIEQMRARLGQS